MELNRLIIEAAILGFERQKQQIDQTITELKAQLNGVSAKTGSEAQIASTTRTKRVMSAAARSRIAAAQKARWAAAREAAPAKKAAPKRRLSPAARAKLAANLAKARAAKAEKAKAAA